MQEITLMSGALSFWQAAFANHGYSTFDIIRERFRGDLHLEPWYRFNSILYAAGARYLGSNEM